MTAPFSKPLVAVVVTFNRLAQIQITLSRLLANRPEVLGHVVVVDNCSSDGTGAYLAAQNDPRLLVLTPKRNLGGAGGFEWGMREAMARFSPDWLVLMDDDGRPEADALEIFLSQDRSQWEAAAAAARLPSGEICGMNRPVLNPFRDRKAFWRTALGEGRSGFHLKDTAYEEGAPEVEIHGGSFVGCFVSARAVARIGYPDGGMFIYGEDGLYTLTLTQAGGKMGFLPQVRFEHDCTSFAGPSQRLTPLWKVYYYHRNLLLLYRVAAGMWFWPALLIVLPKWLSKMRAYGGDRRAFLRLMGRAVRDGLAKRTGTDHDQILRLAETPKR